MSRPKREAPSVEHMMDVLRGELYAAPIWALFEEVRSTTGTGIEGGRVADGIAVHMSAGPWQLHRIEAKRERGDLLTELAHPEKGEEVGRYCAASYFLVPAPYTSVVHKFSELPSDMGLIEVDGCRAKRLRHAVTRKNLVEPPPDFVKSLIRSANLRAERELNGEGSAPLRTIVDIDPIDPRFVILSPCNHRQLRMMEKKPRPRVPCWQCAEEAAKGPGVARAVPGSGEERAA